MSRLTISDVARLVRLKPSAIRYYEKLGIVPAPERIGGKRRYERTVLYRLALVKQARLAGFRLDEIRSLFFDFNPGTRAEARWRRLADRKLQELDRMASEIETMRLLLKRVKANCHCKTLESCGKAILDKAAANPSSSRKQPIQNLRSIYPAERRVIG